VDPSDGATRTDLPSRAVPKDARHARWPKGDFGVTVLGVVAALEGNLPAGRRKPRFRGVLESRRATPTNIRYRVDRQ